MDAVDEVGDDLLELGDVRDGGVLLDQLFDGEGALGHPLLLLEDPDHAPEADRLLLALLLFLVGHQEGGGVVGTLLLGLS